MSKHRERNFFSLLTKQEFALAAFKSRPRFASPVSSFAGAVRGHRFHPFVTYGASSVAKSLFRRVSSILLFSLTVAWSFKFSGYLRGCSG
ncbi:hypothetical protein AALP_AA6G193100 [Arabis alpina]|uniref:Uncharacterized protein n=1 Tax=Arabis alpina TaxID=50452 RepID=A0A087GQ94_ARAAL|nr:hypothetical protein AALP_AA6G193100 [Arabis alpina]